MAISLEEALKSQIEAKKITYRTELFERPIPATILTPRSWILYKYEKSGVTVTA